MTNKNQEAIDHLRLKCNRLDFAMTQGARFLEKPMHIYEHHFASKNY